MKDYFPSRNRPSGQPLQHLLWPSRGRMSGVMAAATGRGVGRPELPRWGRSTCSSRPCPSPPGPRSWGCIWSCLGYTRRGGRGLLRPTQGYQGLAWYWRNHSALYNQVYCRLLCHSESCRERRLWMVIRGWHRTHFLVGVRVGVGRMGRHPPDCRGLWETCNLQE